MSASANAVRVARSVADAAELIRIACGQPMAQGAGGPQQAAGSRRLPALQVHTAAMVALSCHQQPPQQPPAASQAASRVTTHAPAEEVHDTTSSVAGLQGFVLKPDYYR
jgi:hypothetical protein